MKLIELLINYKSKFSKILIIVFVIWAFGMVFWDRNKTEPSIALIDLQDGDLKSQMDTAKILTYVDKTCNVSVPYPSFFEVSDTSEAGTARFCYPNIMDRKITLTMFVETNVEGWSIKDAVEHLSDSTTTCLDSNKYFFIMVGKRKEGNRGCYVEKCFLVNDYWIDYTLFYKPEYEETDGIEKLMEMVMKWEPFGN